MSRLTPEEIQQIAQNYFKEALRRLDCQLDTVESFSKGVKKRMNMDVLAWQGQSTTSPADVQQRLQAIKDTDLIFDAQRLDYLLPDNFKYENPNDPQEVTGMRLGFHNHFDGDSEAVTQYLVSKLSLDAEEGTLSYQSLKKGVERAIAELGRQQHKKLNLEGNLTIEDEWFAPSLPHVASPMTVQPVAYGVSEPISKVYASYLEECQGDKEKTIGKKKTTLELWLEINGDTSMHLLDKEKARHFKDVLRKLPKNMKQRYPGVPIKDIDLNAISSKDRLSVGTINDRLIFMSAFVTWASNNGYYHASNPFSGISLKETVNAKDKRDPFSEDQLKVIFSTPVYKGCKSDNQKGRYKVGNLVIKDGFYWIPLISLYSGARLQEICQLYVTDIRQEHGIWIFDINSNGPDKRLKTESSKRRVPIHKTLIDLGLLDHHASMTKKREKRLFPDVLKSSDGTYSSAFSKKYGHFLRRFKIKTEKTSFHSLRHNVIDTLRSQTDVPRETREALTGHSDARTVSDNYGNAIGVKKLHDALQKLNYPFLKLKK